MSEWKVLGRRMGLVPVQENEVSISKEQIVLGNCVDKDFSGFNHVQVLINENKHLVAFRPAKKEDFGAYKISDRYSKKIFACRTLGKKLQGKRYNLHKINGLWSFHASELGNFSEEEYTVRGYLKNKK